MTALEFESGVPLLSCVTARSSPVAPPLRSRLAIVSPCDELCGIAAYTRSLERQLRDAFDVTVFQLDQYLLRSNHRRVRRIADRHIGDLCAAIAGFDAVNLQLEHGTLGLDPADIDRRFGRIVAAARRISVTFHTIFPVSRLDLGAVLQKMSRFDLAAAADIISEHRRTRRLAAGPTRALRRAQRSKPVAVIVHNRRDFQEMTNIRGLRRVYHHPLSFLRESEAEAIRHTASRRRFALLDAVPDDTRLVGIFGFFGRYKGMETVVRAMHHLPEAHHLLVFGGIHPNAIRPYQSIDPVIAAAFEVGFVDTSLAERLLAQRRDGMPAVSVELDASARDLLIGHPKDLSHRLHFLGPVSDDDFLAGMAICDAVVFPYLEVGQSASGPISQALELGCRVIAARTHTFLQFARYHRDAIEFFDIGNHLELAARILARPQFDPRRRRLGCTVETNKAVYLAANGGSTGSTAIAATTEGEMHCRLGAEPP